MAPAIALTTSAVEPSDGSTSFVISLPAGVTLAPVQTGEVLPVDVRQACTTCGWPVSAGAVCDVDGTVAP